MISVRAEYVHDEIYNIHIIYLIIIIIDDEDDICVPSLVLCNDNL